MIHISASAEGVSEKILMDACRVLEKNACFRAASFHKRCTKEDRDFKMLQNRILTIPCIAVPPAQFEGDNASAEGASEKISSILRGFVTFLALLSSNSPEIELGLNTLPSN